MKKVTLIIALLMNIISFSSYSQSMPYQTSFGFRYGPAKGISITQTIGRNRTIEAIATQQNNGFKITGLIAEHIHPKAIEGLNIYGGVGVHAGTFRNDGGENTKKVAPRKANLGIDAVMGVEYIIPNTALGFSLDYKPSYNLTQSKEKDLANLGLTLRYFILQ